MRYFTLLLSYLSIYSITFGQTSKVFQIDETIVKDSSQWKTPKDFIRQYSSFFEDTNYLVRKTCSGEWGGSIWFKNKITGIEYSCEATCPLAVNKLNGKYIVTSTLAHMAGSTSIIQIDNPSTLVVFKLPPPRKKRGKMRMYYVGDDESQSKQGCTPLLDTFGVFTIASFPYQGQLFHIFTDFKKTFIGTIKSGRFLILDTISNTSLWSYDPVFVATKDGHYLSFFNRDDSMGYLDISDDKIHLIRYK